MVTIPATTKKPTQPWRPASLLTVEAKILAEIRAKGLTPKWVAKDKVDRHKHEGWEVYKSSNPSTVAPGKTAIDGSPLDGTVQKRNLILMVMPTEMVESRRAYFRSLTEGATKRSLNELKEATGGAVYGEIKEGDKTIK